MNVNGNGAVSSSEAEISVVMVVKDAVSTVQRAIDSVLDQSGTRIEVIVVDGASNDGTLEILSRMKGCLACLISEPDNGIADAMNKGLAASRGEWLYFLGADDRLASRDVFSKLLQSVRDHQIDIVSGSVLLESESGTSRRLDPRGFGFGVNFKIPLLHQGTLCRRSLFERIGVFDDSLEIAMDYDFFLRAHRESASVAHIDEIVALMDDRGIGSRTDWDTLQRRILEERRVHLRYCDSAFLRSIYAIYHPAYFLYRRLRALGDI